MGRCLSTLCNVLCSSLVGGSKRQMVAVVMKLLRGKEVPLLRSPFQRHALPITYTKPRTF